MIRGTEFSPGTVEPRVGAGLALASPQSTSPRGLERRVAWHAAIFLLVLSGAVLPSVARAHPFGSRYFAHRTVLRLEPPKVSIEYLIEVPTSVVMREFYVALNGQTPSAEEDARFTREKLKTLLDGLELRIDGTPVPWKDTTDPSARNGVGDVNFFKYRLTAEANVKVSPREFHTLGLYNYNYPAGEAYFNHELWVSDGVEVRNVSWWQFSDSKVATDKTGKWSLDPRLRDLVLSFEVTPSSTGHAAAVRLEDQTHPVQPSPGVATSDNVTSYVPQVQGVPLLPYLQESELSPGLVLLALALAIFFGAAHALSPGHGKTLVAAYLVGSQGTIKDAVILGLTVTVSHTAGVIVLGVVTLFASEYVVPEKLFPVVEFVSGLLIVSIGAWMLRSRWRARAGEDHDHGHPHTHGHEHVHDQSLHHDHVENHHHAPLGHHDHAHVDGHGHDHRHDHVHGHDHVHHHSHGHAHTHEHHHGVPTGEVTVWQLLRLGIAGGMVPCPTALVVLLAAIALHRIALGLALVVAFSVGLAGVLVGIGILMVLAGSFLGRVSRFGKWVGYLPIMSAVLVTILGMIIVGKSLPGLVWIFNLA